MVDIKIGDRVRIKDRPDWYMPSGYRLANAEGRVFEIVEEQEGYVTIQLDNELTGIDKSVPLPFPIDALVKI